METKVKVDLVPERKLEQLASPLLQIVRDAFEDPAIRQEFKEWQKSKEKEAQT